jgi:hypothetical protein
MGCNHFRVRFYDGEEHCFSCDPSTGTGPLRINWVGGGQVGNKAAFHELTLGEAIRKQENDNTKFEKEHPGSKIEPVGKRWI